MPGKTERLRDKACNWHGFNEAPAKCRGKPAPAASRFRRKRASMRPQRNAGENQQLSFIAVESQIGFNEAPAKCRGKRCNQPQPALSSTRLQ